VSSSSRSNDRGKPWQSKASGGHSGPKNRGLRSSDASARDWIWGIHAVEAALANPLRPAPQRLVANPERARTLGALLRRLNMNVGIETQENGEIARLLPAGAVHQGLAMKAPEIEPLDLFDLASPAEGVILMLDQITDPQNIGAIFRSAAAFGVRGIVLQDRHAPPLTGALAKAAAGGIERCPHARVVNLSRALDQLGELGWRNVGLAGDGDQELGEALDDGPVVLVLGSEGEGLRRLVSERCDALARIGLARHMESLNVSAAAAVALYAATKVRASSESVT
jgi:23S rRNA (guanosine2251-2'-O)-methyltransferase